MSHRTPCTSHLHTKHIDYTLEQYLPVYLCIELKWPVMALSRTRTHTHTHTHIDIHRKYLLAFHFVVLLWLNVITAALRGSLLR